MKNIKYTIFIFLITQNLALLPERNAGPTRSGSSLTDSKLDLINSNLTTVISSLSAVAANTAATATNTTSSTGSTATTVTLRNQGDVNHDDPGTAYWTHPLSITNATAGNTFKFSQNILFKPTNATLTAENAAIIINKDNVTIDLCGQTLYFSNSLLTGGLPAISGIHIKAGIKGTQIISSTNNTNYKGAIKDFTEYGIYIKGTSILTVKQTSIDNIICAQNKQGIHVEYANVASISNSQCIANTHATENVYGIFMQNINNVIINNFLANENFSNATTYGIYLENARSCSIKNSSANLNYSTSTGSSGSAYGIYLTSTGTGTSFSNTIDSCIANENYCTANVLILSQEAVGIVLTTASATTESNSITHCEAKRNVYTGSSSPSPLGYGIKLGNSRKNIIESCVTSHNSTSGIIDTLAASTSFFTQNFSFFNGITNYNIVFNKELGASGPNSTPLATIKIHISNHLALQAAMQGLSNIEIVA
jgi:hypothetical protein